MWLIKDEFLCLSDLLGKGYDNLFKEVLMRFFNLLLVKTPPPHTHLVTWSPTRASPTDTMLNESRGKKALN